MQEWPLQDAKNKFSQLVKTTISDGPQLVTRRGAEVVVVIPVELFRKLTSKKQTLVEILQSAPTADIDMERDDEPIRESLL